MNKKILFIILFMLLIINYIFSVRLFYLSTDRTFSVEEQKRIKIESGYGIDSLKIRVYKINNLTKFYLSQDDFHRPKVKGRKLRYFTPELVDDFKGYFRANIREWAREQIPAKSRESMINEYPDFSRKDSESGIYPSKIVDIIKDRNFLFLSETEYMLQNTGSDWNYNYVFLDNLKEGIYLIEGVSKDNVAYTVLNVSDYGFLIKKGNNDILLYTLRTDNSQPVSDIELTVYNRFKKELKKTKTGSNGITRLKLNENDLFIIGKSKNGTYTFFDPKYFPSNVRDNYVYIYTERPVYRGGDQIFFKGVLRKYKDDQYSILNNEKNVFIEIVGPQGNVVHKGRVKTSKEGIFDYKFDLSEVAKSGRYLIIADIDNKKYEAEFKVEYYIKPEFIVKADVDKSVIIAGDRINAEISALYYYGDPVKNAECRYSIYKTRYVEKAWHKDQDKSFYLSEAEYVYSQMELIKTGELMLDESGKASLKIDTQRDDQAYYYNIQLVVSTDSGTPVTGGSNVLVVPSNFKIKIDADKFVYLINENVEVVFFASDYENNPISSNLQIKATTEIAPKKEHTYFSKQVKTDNKGMVSIKFKANKPGFVKIVAMGKDKNGNKTSVEKYIWIGQHGASYNYKGGRINLALDKSYYKVGETAKLLILSPVPDIKFLFTIEGDTIYNYSIEKLSANSMLLSIPIKKNYLPNVFADVSFIFGNELYNNTIKINVPPNDQFLNIDISSDEEIYSPNSKGHFKVKVKDNKNNPVKNTDVSIAVVDEKIYSISNEIAIDIRNYFYPFRRNNVMMWSSIGYRFYGYSMNANSELARTIQKKDTSLAAFKEAEAERKIFKDTALWIASLKTDNAGEASFTVNFPDNITKWRVTAIGITPDTKVGRSSYNVITKLSFFCELVVPKVINQKDKTIVYTRVHNSTNKQLKTDLVLSGRSVNIISDKKQIELKPNSEKTVEWEIKPEKVGDISLKINAKSEKYSDTVIREIKVIPNSIKKIITANKEISVRDNYLSFTLPGNIDLRQEDQILHVNLSHGYASVIVDSLPYLINYPYGCVEQTTSSFLPNLVALNAIKKFKVKLAYKEQKIDDIVNTGLSRLYSFQHQNGSWGWFNEENIDVFMTSYVLYALTLTKGFGYSVSNKVLKTGLDSLEDNIHRAKNDIEKLYGLYVLSMNNIKLPSLLDNIERKMSNLSDYGLAMFILTSVNYGNKNDASKAADLLKKRTNNGNDNTIYWGSISTENWYNDSIETTAWVIKALSKLNQNKGTVSKILGVFSKKDSDELIRKACKWLVFQQKGNHWKSTRDTAASVFALCDYLDSQDFTDDKSYKIKLNQTTLGYIKFNKYSFGSSIDVQVNRYSSYITRTNSIKIEGLTKKDKLFVSMYLSYYTTDENIYASSNKISVKRKYYLLKENKSGNSIKYSISREANSIVKGNNFLVELELVCPKRYEYVFVEDIIPAGCTFVKDFLIYNIDGIDKKWKADYIDYRDNKINFFLTRTESVKLYYVLTPVYKGNFKVIPTIVSLMYFPEIRGNSNDNTFIIE